MKTQSIEKNNLVFETHYISVKSATDWVDEDDFTRQGVYLEEVIYQETVEA